MTPVCYRCREPLPCRCDAALVHGDCIEVMNDMPADSVDLVFGSPPYCDARTYGIGAQRDCVEWVEWMLSVTEAAARICKGPVIWVAAGVTRKRNYWPACEGLMWEWYKRGGAHQLYRPCVFHCVGIPGSGGKDWFRADWEYIMCFKRPGELAWADNTACGEACKYPVGGAMSYRHADGQRRNAKTGRRLGAKVERFMREGSDVPGARLHTKREPNGEMRTQAYIPPERANPGNVFKITVGGGNIGSQLAHENEAPFPEALAKIFVLSCCPEGGTVLDPFIGSGTTAAVAQREGRKCIGIDLRQSQVELSTDRLRQGTLL